MIICEMRGCPFDAMMNPLETPTGFALGANNICACPDSARMYIPP